MPTKVEKDSVTGTETTGHEWDGLKELNTPLPKWWLYVLYATIIFSLIYWVFMPTIPGVRGITGYNQREDVAERIADARAAQSGYLTSIAAADLGTIRTDPELLTFAMAAGASAFGDNCAGCHGNAGQGAANFPTLADDDWLWGGTLEEIHTTIVHGIRNKDDDLARLSEMPPFGDILPREEIEAVASYVLAMGRGDADPDSRGATVFLEQCSACHMEDGSGMVEMGAPNLVDAIWLYGGSRSAVISQILHPQHGVMPAWEERLSPETIKMLAVYVHALGGGEADGDGEDM